jgi:predicted flavoprotein YhiN
VHHLLVFFKNTLTIPKIKDLVNAPMQKYEDMYSIIHQEKQPRSTMNIDELLPKFDIKQETHNETKNEMKNELKNFLKKQLGQGGSTNISTLDAIGEGNSFASY